MKDFKKGSLFTPHSNVFLSNTPLSMREEEACSHYLDEATIAAFIAGKLGKAEEEVMRKIIDNCEACRERFRRVSEELRLLTEEVSGIEEGEGEA